MTMLNTKSAKKNEKGIALIFTLIMLSLLLILALSFTMDSMFEQKGAYNSANASSARFLAEAQLKQVLALIKADETNFADGNIYSADFHYGHVVPPAPLIYTDMLEERPSTDPNPQRSRLWVYGVLDDNNDNSCLKTDVKVNWNYIRSGPLVTDTIVGRTAFVVIPDAKIPLDSLVDDRTGTVVYPQHNEKDDTETRIGKYVSEINVRAAIPTVVTDIGTITDKLNWNTIGSGLYDGSWASFTSLFNAITEIIPADEAAFQSNLSLSVSDDKEAFWADKNANEKIDDGEMYKRFDLTRDCTTTAADWDTSRDFVYYNILLMSNPATIDDATEVAPGEEMEGWADIASGATSKGLPWLACFGYDKTGAPIDLKEKFPTTTLRRCQIAANLKDYCDTDNKPTSNINPTAWDGLGAGIHPLFTGNERTPYLNEVGVCVTATYNGSGTGPYSVSATLELKGYVELINIYGADWASNLEVVIKGVVKIIPTIGGVAKSEETKPIDVIVDVGTWNNGYSNLAFTADATIPCETVTDLSAVPSIKVDVTEVKIERVVLREKLGSARYDYVKTLTKTSTKEILNGNGTGRGWYSWAVHDPRQNLNSGDWQELDPPVATAGDVPGSAFSIGVGTSANSTAAGPNPTEAPTFGPDLEVATDPANGELSTAYIRNAPMESPWELGFIHRGAKWETINLKKYDPAKGISTFSITGTPDRYYIAGGGAYADGDANILDQIKMTAEPKSPQKINLKATDDMFFDALFSKIKLKPTIDSAMSVSSMAGGSDVEMLAGVSTIISNVKTKFTDDVTYLPNTKLTRASIVDQLLLPLGGTITATTDAAQEELIGKIVNLTKIGNATGNFTIIVLAQTIKDVEGPIFKYSADGTTSGNQTCALGTFNAIINADSNKSVYFDEITSEQKILVKGSFDGTTLKIISFQYIE